MIQKLYAHHLFESIQPFMNHICTKS